MSLFSGLGDMLGGVFGGLFGTGSNSTTNSFLNTDGASGSPLSMVTDPAGWWDQFKNGKQGEQVDKTNATNKEIADDLNASNERIANATNDANIQMNDANNKTNLDIANATNQANLDIANQNINFQKETNAKNEQLMREQWAREDTAYSRTAQDMRNAGINPLAMNGTNGAGSVVSQTAPLNTATMQGATMNAGHVEPWTKEGWQADYRYESLSDFSVVSQMLGVISNLANASATARKTRAEAEAIETDNAYNSTAGTKTNNYWDEEKQQLVTEVEKVPMSNAERNQKNIWKDQELKADANEISREANKINRQNNIDKNELEKEMKKMGIGSDIISTLLKMIM